MLVGRCCFMYMRLNNANLRKCRAAWRQHWGDTLPQTNKIRNNQLASKRLQRSHPITHTFITRSPVRASRWKWRWFGFWTRWFHLAQINKLSWHHRSIFMMVVFILTAKYELTHQLTIHLFMIIINSDSEKHWVSYWRANTKRTSQSIQSLKFHLNSTSVHFQQQLKPEISHKPVSQINLSVNN